MKFAIDRDYSPLMETSSDRRRPDRQAFVLRFLRRIAVLALIIALLIWVVPTLLVRAGVLGPSASQRIDEASAAVATARAYGASGGPALAAAERKLAEARTLAAGGKGSEARRAAEEAAASAIEAQKAALVSQSEMQRRAEVVYNDLDREINDLEKLYEAAAPGLEKEQVAHLLSLMKVTRQSTGVLFLAYEQKDYGRVLEGERHARDVVASTRSRLESARRR
jgi:hypothetical protein